MLVSLLGFVLLGLLMAAPLWHLLRWLGRTSGLYTPQRKYLRPYVPTGIGRAPSDAPAAMPQEKSPP